jgi:hypothetical protein
MDVVMKVQHGLVLWLCITPFLAGCALNAPNQNEKARYSMVMNHARQVLREAGSSLAPHRDYDRAIFWRKYYDKDAHNMRVWELYDFVKIAPGPGPEHFVIVYEENTRKTYLRTNLRSVENLERLPTTQPAAAGE